MLQAARGLRPPLPHIVGRKVGGDGTAWPNCQIGMRMVSCDAGIFLHEHEVFRNVPPKYPLVEPRHGMSARPTPQLFPPTTAKTFFRHRVLKRFERLRAHKILATIVRRASAQPAPKKQARRGADSAPTPPLGGVGWAETPRLARGPPLPNRCSWGLPAAKVVGLAYD